MPKSSETVRWIELGKHTSRYFFSLHRCRCFTDAGTACDWGDVDAVDFGRYAAFLRLDVDLHVVPLLSVLFEEHFDDVAKDTNEQ